MSILEKYFLFGVFIGCAFTVLGFVVARMTEDIFRGRK